MDYKPTYTKEEVDELLNWFDTHKYERELDLGHGLRISDVSATLTPMRNIALAKHDNRTFSGQIQLLFRIREELIKQGKVTEGE
ncbi:MAG: hypothetical protein J1F40_03530 [Prevotellaceae bacterium]|nr:hypothetical protein [Prevotellaceae bacterium]